jgi:hypothetical protein
MDKKLNYHKDRSTKASLDRSNPQITTSSPILESKVPEFFRMDRDEDSLDDGIKNTIQSINEKDNVNYFLESNNTGDVKTAGIINSKKMKQVNFKESLILFDSDNNYARGSEKLLNTIVDSIDYFNKVNDFKPDLKGGQFIKMPKEDYEKLKNEFDILVNENAKLKEKNKILIKNNSSVKHSANSSRDYNNQNNESVNLNKFLEFSVLIQSKNEKLEEENKVLKNENDNLVKQLKFMKKKMKALGGYSNSNNMQMHNPKEEMNMKKTQSKSQLQQINNKKLNYENMLKDSINQMSKILNLIQMEKDNTTTTSISVKFLNLN